jgi:hypothetical protein
MLLFPYRVISLVMGNCYNAHEHIIADNCGDVFMYIAH